MVDASLSGDIKLYGFDELDKAFERVKDESKGDVLRKALREGARVVLDAAKRKVPKDTGELSRNIRMKFVKKGLYSAQYNIFVARSRKRKVNGTLQVVGGGYYGHMIEYGTGLYGPKGREYWIPRKSGKVVKFIDKRTGKEVVVERFKHPGMRPRPFMRPAFDENKRRTIDVFGMEFGKGIEAAFVKQGMAYSPVSAGAMNYSWND